MHALMYVLLYVPPMHTHIFIHPVYDRRSHPLSMCVSVCVCACDSPTRPQQLPLPASIYTCARECKLRYVRAHSFYVHVCTCVRMHVCVTRTIVYPPTHIQAV